MVENQSVIGLSKFKKSIGNWRFYPTYEALKQDNDIADAICIGGFYPTYEALKRVINIPKIEKNARFYPTYEALKL